MAVARAAMLTALVLGACFDPHYDRPRCGPGDSCPDGLRCVRDVCEAASADAGSDDAQRCDQGGGCPADQLCVEHVCVPAAGDGGIDAAPCGPAGECPGGQVCTDGVCR